MVRCLKAGIKTPVLRYVDMNRYCVIMSYIDGYTVRDYINKSLYSSGFILLIRLQLEEELNRYCFKIGETVARLHNHNLIHGDLTTSNFMIEGGTGDLVVIDFGLTSVSTSAEDMGVDLYVLERAFISTHVQAKDLVEMRSDSY